MNLDISTIDDIVARVLNQLGTDGNGASNGHEAALTTVKQSPTAISERVITAETIAAHNNGSGKIHVNENAIVTPAAWDAVRDQRITITRGGDSGLAASDLEGTQKCAAQMTLLLVVRHTDAVARLVDDLPTNSTHELLGCPDEAAAAAISAVCRGDANSVIVFVEQSHRVACLVNRNPQVHAISIGNAGELQRARKTMPVNVCSIDPSQLSWFELRRVIQASAEV